LPFYTEFDNRMNNEIVDTACILFLVPDEIRKDL